MPTYDYKCSQCKYRFEYFQPITAKPLTECPKCGGALKRVIGTGAGTIFKGSGFYQTDYKNKSTNKNDDTKTEQKSSTGEKNDNKADKK